MSRSFRFLALVAAVPAALALAPAPASRPEASAPISDPAAVARGRYLTHDVAMCVQCHSPRDEKGEIQRGDEFRGAPIPLASPFHGLPWAIRAPNLRGLEGFSDEMILRLLREGIAHTGAAPQSPMPPFRMTQEDAKAIVAYLRSLR